MKVGDSVGHYRVIARIARGGMGEVWLAEHPEVRKRVAVKVAPGRDESVRRRFLVEARAVAELQHPQVVQLFDFGVTDGGELYFTMEHLDGRPLGAVLAEEKRLATPRAIRIAAQVADALSGAHARGVVHRDLKPDNVLLLEGDRIKLLDFGLAKLMDGGARTAEGVVLGTTEYMSPEQCAGRRDIDGRADLYALGCLLYELLSGAPPFRGAAEEVLRAHRTQPPAPIAGLTPALAQLLERLLAKDPDARIADAGELRDQLLEIRGESARAVAPSRARRRGPIAIGLGALLAALVAGGGWIALRRGTVPLAPAPPSVATGPRTLSIRSVPAGATVIVDGIGYGPSPVEVVIGPRTAAARVEIVLPGYGTWRGAIDPEHDARIEAVLSPEPVPAVAAPAVAAPAVAAPAVAAPARAAPARAKAAAREPRRAAARATAVDDSLLAPR